MSARPSIRSSGETEFFTLVQLLRARALERPEERAYVFLPDGEQEEHALAYAELDHRARAIAAALQDAGATGERALLLYPPGLDYIAAFFGCLYAGVVAVPAYPPRLNRTLSRIEAIAADAQAAFALATSQVTTRIGPILEESPALARMRWLSTDDAPDALAADWREAHAATDSLAYLQYTSGSTALPKGVMISHANVLSNSAYIYAGFAHTPESVSLSWLPHYHDMGLVDGIIQPLYGGFTGYLMPPVALLQSPAKWLQAISRYRVTHSGGPNFAYDLCTRRVAPEQRAALDLSAWSVAYNGAEPVRRETMENFAEAFASCGFRRSAFYPAYGLAEATLKVTGGARDAGPVYFPVRADALERDHVADAGDDDAGAMRGDVRHLAGSGHATSDTSVVIVHPETERRCAPDEVGEIWVMGPGVACGYWNRPDETERTFRARLADTGEGPFLRTGDLGFIKDGELFVTGRLKDLIIIRGRNHYPQDIELTVERAHAALRAGCGAAFSVDTEGEERLVVVQEVERRATVEPDEVFERIRRAVAETHEAQSHAIVLVKAGSVPKTSSGKTQRRACREMFLRGEFEVIAEWRESATRDVEETANAFTADTNDVESWLRARLSARLGVDASRIDMDRPVVSYGLDSLASVEMMMEVERRFGVALPLSVFLQGTNLRELASEVRRQSDVALPALVASHEHEDGAVHPLSHGQRALWFLHRVAPESAAYNVAAAARVLSEFDTDALRRAFQALVERHAALRTTFESRDGEPVQIVSERAEVSFDVEDASGNDENQLRARLVDEAHRPFDLERGPLFRVRLFERSRGGHVLLLTAHHIVVDFWSLGVLMRELGELYRAAREGVAASLAPHALRYTDYARWQTELLAGAEGERLWSYWREQLAGTLPVLDLPTDHPRPAVQTYRGASHAFVVREDVGDQLRSLAQQHGATLYMTLLAAFQTLLVRYTGQQEVVVGSPTTGRSRAELAETVGYFVNPVALRADVSRELTFEEFLAQVRRTALAAFKHQDYPFALLVKSLQPERDASRSPVFQTMFALQKTHGAGGEELAAFALGEAGARVRLGALELESVRLDQRVAQFDISLTMAETGGTLAGSLEYNADLFDRATVERMAAHFQTLLEGITANPRARLAELPLLDDKERRRLLVEWNETDARRAAQDCLHRIFEAQAARTPDSTALIFGEERLTYAELNARANQLAHHLRARGVRPETHVAVCLSRSTRMIVALLGVLKAGGAYVPLDAAYPQERIAFMLKDSRARVLVTERGLVEQSGRESWRAGEGTSLVCLDADDAGIASESDENPAVDVFGENQAYVIYTSGSTGRPKGVVVQHASLTNYVEAACAAFRIDQHDRVLQFASISFDASAEDIYPALTRGATLVLRDDTMLASASGFLRRCREWGITVLDLPTAYWHELTARGTAEEWASLDALRLVVIGGERALPERLAEWRELTGRRVRLLNTYGPTEATVVATMYETEDAARYGVMREVPIGRPVSNARVYVLDRYAQLVPAGVAGELFIGGAGLARGYLDRPDLTAEKFVPDSLGVEAGARLYRTGDLARWHADGQLEFLGRVDQQVKVRGFRVELAEVEAALEAHPSVRTCVVVAREDVPGDRRLVAYVVSVGDEAASAVELRDYLKRCLPDYMIPSAFVALDQLPLTTGGKIDRRALPAPENARTETTGEFVAPRNETERALAGIWADVLRLDRVGVEDNFFELGGDSILSIQVVARARQAGIEVPPGQIFRYATIAELAAASSTLHVEETAATGEEPPRTTNKSGVVMLHEKHADAEDVYPLSPTQQGLLFHSLYEQGASVYAGLLSFEIRGAFDVRAFEEAWQRAASRHTALRTSFEWENLEEPLQVVHRDVRLPLEQHDWRGLSHAEQEARFEALQDDERRRGFDLTSAPLMRLALVRTANDAYRFVWSQHHLLFDGWSLSLLVKEVFESYRAMAGDDGAAELPEARPYRDYIDWLGRQDLAGAERFWRATLEGFTAATPLAVDRAASEPHEGDAYGAVRARLPEATTDALRTLARSSRLTLNTLVQGAWAVLLSRYSRERDIVFGATTAGRPAQLAGVESMVGLFINTLPVRVEVQPDAPLVAWLTELQQRQAEARRFEHVPLVEVQGWSEVPRGMPLFESIFVFENFPVDASALTPGAGVEVGDVRTFETTNYPLTVIVVPGAELSLEILYDARRFDATTAETMLGHLRTLLEGVAARPGVRLAELPMLTLEERQRMLVQWNDTRRDYPRGQRMQDLFEAQVALTPDAVALVHKDGRLTYRELNERMNKLAHHLRRLGVGPEKLVGLCVERTPEMVIGMLGILKAGGAYLPLDPEYPPDRVAFMLEDGRARVLLTQERLLARLPAHDAHVVLLDAGWNQLDVESAANPASEAVSENLAYVIYTSGSTGRPKGVAITHRSAATFLHWARESFAPEDRAGIVTLSSMCFDLSVFEIFVPLSWGGRVIIAESALKLTALPEDAGITLINSVPSATSELLRISSVPASVTTINLAGEPLPHKLVRELYALGTVKQVFNLYGPSEDTTYSTWALMDPEAPPTIGRPVANTQSYLLDESLNPVPVGVIGELYLGGDGLARGYLDRPDMTAERFIPDPFSGTPGARLYKTGDLARYLPDGRIDFLGRNDHQVKIRGYRIELGEVEAALRRHPAVGECVVVAREDEPGEKRLVAYVVGKAGQRPSAGELWGFLKETLLAHMIPSAFVVLDQLPLSPNGKIDRKALPAPDDARPDVRAEYVAPRNDIEGVLCGMWSEVLGVGRVGIHDNFFELGGHSLLATRVMARVRQALRVELPLQKVFEAATIEELARVVVAHEAVPGQTEKIARVLRKLEGMSPEERQAALRRKRMERGEV